MTFRASFAIAACALWFPLAARAQWTAQKPGSDNTTAQPTERWEGPIVLRGMSRSGMMHTMAGHGPFEKEPCAKYGFR